MWQLLSDLLFTSYFWSECTPCQWTVLTHSMKSLKNWGVYRWCWGRTPGRVSATLWERSQQIHLQCWRTLLEVSLENRLLIERSTNHFEQKHISLLILPRKYETIAFVYCLTTGSTSFCWNIALRYKTCINLVTQSKTWGRHRSNLTLGGTVSHSSAFGICRPLWLFLVGILQMKGFQNITVKVFLRGVCMQEGDVINACLQVTGLLCSAGVWRRVLLTKTAAISLSTSLATTGLLQ